MCRRPLSLLVLALSSFGLAACADLTGPVSDQGVANQLQDSGSQASAQITQGTGIRSSGTSTESTTTDSTRTPTSSQITQGTGI